ncbi:MAG: peptidylprolyl isomerase [Gemmatimonadaceae bacterium]|nr:peptidylprolyl isomerase [Gemmatimonadaceae bacterium]
MKTLLSPHAWRRLRRLVFMPALLLACSDAPPRHVVIGPAPDSFRVLFTTNKGTFVAQVERAWAPNGADRFHALAGEGFFDENRFFRVLPGFIAQFGANDDRDRNKRWEEKPLPDDPAREKNRRGTISFASLGPNTRTHQLFVNLKDNTSLDAQGFTPIGRVIEGMGVVDSIYDEYGEDPRYQLIATQGNKYLARMFPKLDYITTATIVASGTVK